MMKSFIFYFATLIIGFAVAVAAAGAGGGQSFSFGPDGKGDGVCSYVNDDGRSISIHYEVIGKKQRILETEPRRVSNPQQRLKECQELSASFVPSFTKLAQAFVPKLPISRPSIVPSGGLSPFKRTDVRTSSSSSGGSGSGFSFSSSGSNGAPTRGAFGFSSGSDEGGGTCTYADADGNNVMINYELSNGKPVIKETYPKRLKNPTRQLFACQNANAKFASGLAHQLSQQQQALQDHFSRMHQNFFGNFNDFFPGNFPFGRKK